MMPRIPPGLLLQRVRPGSGGSALRGGPGPPPAGRVGGPRGSPAAVLEECLPQNSQIVKNNSGGFCLTFALKDFFPPAENCAAAGKVSGGAGRGGGQGCVQGSGSAPFLGHAPCGLGSSIRSGTGGARWEHALLPCSPGHVSGAPRTTGWTEAGVSFRPRPGLWVGWKRPSRRVLPDRPSNQYLCKCSQLGRMCPALRPGGGTELASGGSRLVASLRERRGWVPGGSVEAFNLLGGPLVGVCCGPPQESEQPVSVCP